jgi:hypothetical protein
MAKTLAPAKTPGVAIARVLRGLGLKQGTDFSVKGEYKNGERVCTRVAVFGGPANQIVADNANLVEQQAGDAGFHFNVSVYFTPSGIMWVSVANFGQRTRQTHFLSDSGRTENTAEAAPKPVIRATLAAPRPAFEQPEQPEQPKTFDPYAGHHTRTFENRVWGCAEAGQTWFFQTTEHGPRYTLRHYAGRTMTYGWYLSGPGISGDMFLGPRLNVAAHRANGRLDDVAALTATMNQVVQDYPKGQRVQGMDNYGVTCMGTVNGVAWGAVTDPSHPNYGRTWADVDWDEYPHNQGTGRRSRPFVSDLIKH